MNVTLNVNVVVFHLTWHGGTFYIFPYYNKKTTKQQQNNNNHSFFKINDINISYIFATTK